MSALKQDRHHILTLVIQRHDDVPKIRGKVKFLAKSIGCDRLQTARLATAASEVSRLILSHYHDGKVSMSLVHSPDYAGVFLELLFHSTMPCISGEFSPDERSLCPQGVNGVLQMKPLSVLRTLFDNIHVEGGTGNIPITLRCLSNIPGLVWQEDLLKRIKTIRKKLFQDTEESYMENLRAKHEEVLRLLREKTEKNRILDEANNELLQLTNDMEKLAEERTIIEMSLKVADQVRNPATIIGGLSRRVLKKNTMSEDINSKMRQIIDQADQIEKIVQQFHNMARERSTLFGREDLEQLVRDSLQTCPTIQRRFLDVKFDGHEIPLYVHANRHILKVAIVHALRHAANESRQGGQLIVAVRQEKGRPVLEIVFMGTELPGKSSPYYGQADVASQKISSLPLVQQILAEHQAELEIENVLPPDKGIRVTMYFPLVWKDQGKMD